MKLSCRELEALKLVCESSVKEAKEQEKGAYKLETVLRQREWQLTDVTAVKDSR